MTQLDLVALALLLVYALALMNVFHVLRYYRTAQGAIGWIIGLLAFPYLALPIYFLFGRYRFEGYIGWRRNEIRLLEPVLEALPDDTDEYICEVPPQAPEMAAIARLLTTPFTSGNHAELLINGAATFESMFEAIAAATDYVLIEFYIVRDDNMGRKLSELLLGKLGEGVRVYFLYDDIGSAWLSKRYIKRLQKAGAEVRSFNTVSKKPKRLQINFRNHRKLLITDGLVAFAGGINIGNEYVGLNPGLSPWRDTHLKIEGPAARVLQQVFVQDWYWSADQVPPLNWRAPESPETGAGQRILVIPSSAADEREVASLWLLSCIHNARERLWIASPYFVPDLQISQALELAVLRGVDVRIIVPHRPDNWLVHWASFTYLENATQCGVKVYQYERGFMHQKVICVDNRYATVGTANLDNRSLRLNFEVTLLVAETSFTQEVANMLEQDFRDSRLLKAADFETVPLWYRLLCRAARLLAPVL